MARQRVPNEEEYFYFTLPTGKQHEYAYVEGRLKQMGLESHVAVSPSGCRCYRIKQAEGYKMPGEYPYHGIDLSVEVERWHGYMYRNNPIPVIYCDWAKLSETHEVQSTSQRKRVRA